MPKNGHYNDETYIKIWINHARHQWCDRTDVHIGVHLVQSCEFHILE